MRSFSVFITENGNKQSSGISNRRTPPSVLYGPLYGSDLWYDRGLMPHPKGFIGHEFTQMDRK